MHYVPLLDFVSAVAWYIVGANTTAAVVVVVVVVTVIAII